MASSERYNRQSLIEGWEQEKITDTSAIVIGSGLLSDFTLIDLSSLGVGNITRIGYSDSFEFERINPEICFEQVKEEITNRQIAEVLLDSEIVIDATNDVRSKFHSFRVARNKGAYYFSGFSRPSGFVFFDGNVPGLESRILNLPEAKEGVVSSILCSAIIADEMRKRIMPIKDDIILKELRYMEIIEANVSLDEFGHKKIYQVGAGAIGTFSSLALGMLGFNVRVADFDTIDESNLHRQFLFYDRVGHNKAKVLEERLKRYYKGEIKGVDVKVDVKFDAHDCDFLFSCVDNNIARYYLNQYAFRRSIPLINGGTSVFAGHTMAYYPGRTACLDCQLGYKLSESVKEEAVTRRGGACFHPTHIIPNQIVGALIVNSFLKSIKGVYQQSNFISGAGIYDKIVNESCFRGCKLVE